MPALLAAARTGKLSEVTAILEAKTKVWTDEHKGHPSVTADYWHSFLLPAPHRMSINAALTARPPSIGLCLEATRGLLHC